MASTLALWHPTAEAQLTAANLAWGTIPPRSTGDLRFRVRNRSTTKTANTITVSLVDLDDPVASPTVASQQLLSADGLLFTASLTITQLKPLMTTAVLTLRRVTASTADAGVGRFRLLANAATWT